jgi:CBS domain-containing protein
METEFSKLLLRTKAVDVLGNQKLCCGYGNQTIEDCLKTLKDNDICGMPVLEAEGSRKAIGFVDVLDICAFALNLWRSYASKMKFSELLEQNRFFQTKVSAIMNFSRRNEFMALKDDCTLMDCLNCFVSRQHRSHRIALLDNSGNIRCILSMWDLVNFASKHGATIPLCDRSLKDLQLWKPCLMVRHDVYTVDALDILVDNRISGVAVVDLENKLIANFSASDLKGMTRGAFDLFDKPLIDFIRSGTTTKSKMPPISLKYNSPFGECLKTMADNKIHRVFITDTNQKPFSIVSCTDVVNCINPAMRQGEMSQPTNK